MTEHVEAKSATLADELLGVVQAVEGVSAVYPAQPLWQSVAGAAVAAVTGEQLPLINLTEQDGTLAIKARIGVGSPLPAPKVAREAAAAIRRHLGNVPAVVEVLVAKIEA